MNRIFVLLIFGAIVFAAEPSQELGTGIGQKMRQNADELKQYTHKRRTEIKINGQVKGARLDLVRYIDGEMDVVPLESPASTSARTGGRGLRGRIVEKRIEKKKEEMKDEVDNLKSLLESYLSPASGSMRTMLEKAVISRTGPAPDADVTVAVTGLVKPSDAVKLVWSPVNRQPKEIEIRSQVEGKPVRVAVDFAALPHGPFYAAHTVIDVPKKNLFVIIDTFDYIPASTAR